MFARPDRRPSPAIAVPIGTGWGIALATGAALISGLAIYLNAFAVKQLPDAAVYTTLKNAVAAIVLLTVVVGLCDRLSAQQLGKLITWTSREIAIANLTI